MGKRQQTLAGMISPTRVVELRLCQGFSSSAVPTAMWIYVPARGKMRRAVLPGPVGLFCPQLYGSCYPSILQGDRKDLSGRDMSFFGSTDSEKSTMCFQQGGVAGEHQTTPKG